MPVDIAHELLQSVLGVENLLAGLTRLRVGAQVGQCDADTGIEVGQLAHTACDDVPLEGSGGEDGRIGPELLACAALCGLADDLDGVEGLALLVFLLIDMAVAINLRQHVGGQGVDAAHTYAMKSAGNLIRVLIKLTAGVEHGHHDLKGALVQLLVLINRDTAAVILNGAAAVGIDGHLYVGAVAGHGFVDTVVNGLVDQMVQSFFAHVADIHGRTLAYSLQAFEDLNI